jgi:predicted ester cyclase
VTQLDAEAIVRRFIGEMWDGPRPELVDVVVHPDYRADGRVVGREFVRRNIARMHRGFSDLALEITHLVVEGDRVALMFEWVGTHDGPFGGIEPTGRTIRFREAGFFRVEDDMVIEGDFVADGLGARIQLGVLPEDFWTNPHR